MVDVIFVDCVDCVTRGMLHVVIVSFGDTFVAHVDFIDVSVAVADDRGHVFVVDVTDPVFVIDDT